MCTSYREDTTQKVKKEISLGLRINTEMEKVKLKGYYIPVLFRITMSFVLFPT